MFSLLLFAGESPQNPQSENEFVKIFDTVGTVEAAHPMFDTVGAVGMAYPMYRLGYAVTARCQH